jgi:hypothetical protein
LFKRKLGSGTYTEEEPNSLTVDEVPRFMATARAHYPQHFAMLALGLATGRRPSELRPLRRQGPTPDILWTDGVLLVRRSETRGEVMERTKTGGYRAPSCLDKPIVEIAKAAEIKKALSPRFMRRTFQDPAAPFVRWLAPPLLEPPPATKAQRTMHQEIHLITLRASHPWPASGQTTLHSTVWVQKKNPCSHVHVLSVVGFPQQDDFP